MNLKILNKKQIKEILALIKQQWNTDIDLDYVFLEGNDDKIFIINKDFAELDLTKLRINNMGLYFAQKMIDGIRLSIEGSQIIGPKAKKNVLELDNKQTKQWLQGYDLEITADLKNYVILKHKNDFLGAGKIKQNKILNYIPKTRRLKTII
jgi:NOL1/NOP2/fmu family ribosome biogenesis protein